MAEVIVAVFQTAEQTEAAMRAVEAAGVPANTIRRYGSPPASGAEPSQTYGDGMGIGNFWRWILGEETGHDMNETVPGRAPVDRAVAGGGTVLAVPVEEAHVATVMDVLQAQNPVSLHERDAEPAAGSGVRRYSVG